MSTPFPRFIDASERYAVVQELGRGGMATVYKVIDTKVENQPQVALKLASSDPGIRDTSWRNLKSEFLVASRIRHRRTVKVLEQGESISGAPFFTMEITSGLALSEVLQQRAGTTWFSTSEIIELLSQIAEALLAVHDAGLVYADLKPSNILVTEHEGRSDLTLIDFGIACEGVPFDDNPTLDSSSSSGLTGTSLYMSPEQIRGFPLTIRSDIYSFGIVAFQLCTQKLPFGGEGIFSVTASHLMGRVPSVRDVNPSIPKGLERMVQVALEKQPGDRYASMTEILNRLDKLINEGQTGGFLKRIFTRILPRKKEQARTK